MNFHLTLIFCLIAVSVSVSSKVMVRQVPYSCCHSPALEFDQRCQNTWSVDDKNIAHFAKGDIICEAPCKKIESGQMTLDVCMDVNLTMVCQHHLRMVKEDFLYYQSQPCPRSFANGAPSQSAVGLALLTAGWIVKIIQETICFI